MEDTRLKFLWNAAHLWSVKNFTQSVLKSHYLTLCRQIAKLENRDENLKFDKKTMCTKCSSCWFDGNFTIKTIPKQLKHSKGKNLIEAYKAGKKLTKKQKMRAKWYLKKSESHIVITCKLCGYKTKISLQKPKTKSNTKPEQLQQDSQTNVDKLKKKKRKQKDKFAGLKLDVVQKSQTNKLPPPSSSSSSNVRTTAQNQNTNVKTHLPSSSTTPAIQKANSKMKKNNNDKKPTQKRIEQSKTQKKNTLLKLAQILKKNNQNTSANDRLKNLLR